MTYRHGYWEGTLDPGNERYYAACVAARKRIAEIVPLASVTYVGFAAKGVTVLWYWGKIESGFAFGPTVDQAAADVERKVFRGL